MYPGFGPACQSPLLPPLPPPSPENPSSSIPSPCLPLIFFPSHFITGRPCQQTGLHLHSSSSRSPPRARYRPLSIFCHLHPTWWPSSSPPFLGTPLHLNIWGSTFLLATTLLGLDWLWFIYPYPSTETHPSKAQFNHISTLHNGSIIK